MSLSKSPSLLSWNSGSLDGSGGPREVSGSFGSGDGVLDAAVATVDVGDGAQFVACFAARFLRNLLSWTARALCIKPFGFLVSRSVLAAEAFWDSLPNSSGNSLSQRLSDQVVDLRLRQLLVRCFGLLAF